MKMSRALVMLLLCLLLTTSLSAQTSSTGALSGTVTDPSGAVLPNTSVTLVSSGTGQIRTVTTTADGSYAFTLLSPGQYRVKFEASGFNPVDVPSLTVTVTETAVLNESLAVGSSAQQITVQTTEEAVQTTNATLGTVMSTKTMTDVPLATRNYTNMISLTAGASAAVPNATTLGKGGVNTAVNGSAAAQDNYQMDGTSVNTLFSFPSVAESPTSFYAAIPVPSPEAIQEFKIQTSNYDASYGRNTGANVNVVTKSGTNLFHGSGFEFFRNTVLNANDWFRNFTGGARLPFNQNQFGGTLGGPVKKDKLFFFASYQQTGQKNGISTFGYSTVTLPAIPAGNRGSCPVGWKSISQCDATGQAFIGSLGNSVCPTNPANAPYKSFDTTTVGGLQVACNGSNINPVAINLLQLKLPNGNYYMLGTGSNAYTTATFSDPAVYNEWQGIGNVDYLLNSKNTLSLRFLDAPSAVAAPFGVGVGLLGTPVGAHRNYTAANVKVTTLLSNSLINEARVSYVQAVSINSYTSPFTDSQVGIAPLNPDYNVLTFININGIYDIGRQWFTDTKMANDEYGLGDQMSWDHGKHIVRFGVDLNRTLMNQSIRSMEGGEPIFNSFPDFLIGRAACPAGTFGNGAGQCNTSNPGSSNGTQTSSLSGVGGSCSGACTTLWGPDPSDYLQHYIADALDTFVQDDFKVRPTLTVNLGLRWEYDGWAWEKDGHFAGIWQSTVLSQPYPGNSPATGTLVGYVAPANFPGNLPTGVTRLSNNFYSDPPPKDLFAPRLGFAWSPKSKLAVRGGIGIFYDRINGETLTVGGAGTAPYSVGIVVQPSSNLAAPFVVPQLIPGPPGAPGWAPRWANYSTLQSSNLGSAALDQHLKIGTTDEWNLNVQYAFLPSWLLELGYVGSHGIHESNEGGTGYEADPINTAVLASASQPVCAGSNCITTNTVANVSFRVPLIGFSPIFQTTETQGHYKYNSLQATVRKQLSHGLTFQAAYTWNRAFLNAYMGNPNAAPGTLGYVDQYVLNPAYYPQRFVISYAWQIPSGTHDGVVGKLVNGWGISGVTVLQDGVPLTMYDTRAGTAFNPSLTGSLSGLVPQAQFCTGMGPANVATSGGLEAKVINGLTGGPGYLNGRTQGVFCTPPTIGSDGAATGFGSAGSGWILGPGQFNFDTAFTKDTKVGGLREDATLQFRAEFFNFFNHPQFSNPATTVNSGTFGRITTMSVSPRLVQLALRYSF
jgi:hypothetical protein